MSRDSKRTKSSPSRNIPAVLRYVESMCSCFQGLESNCSVIGEVLAHCALCNVKNFFQVLQEKELRSRGVGGNERKRWTFPPEDPEQKALKEKLGMKEWEKTVLKSWGDSGRGTGSGAAGGSSRELFKSLEEAEKTPEPTVTRGEKEDTGSVTPEKAEEDRQKIISLEMEEADSQRKEKERLREEQIAR